MRNEEKFRASNTDSSDFISDRELRTYRQSELEHLLKIMYGRNIFLLVIIAFLITNTILLLTLNGFYILVTCPIFWYLKNKSLNYQENRMLPGRKPSYLFPKDKEKGEMFLGREVDTGFHIYQSSSDFLYHTLLLGASGSGKTILIQSAFICNYLSINSGFVLQDFKGTVQLILQVQSMLARFGRANCFRCLNYNDRQNKGSTRKNTNTSNMLLSDNHENSLLFLNGFIPEATGDGKFFVDGAIDILRSILPILHDLQRRNLMKITFSSIGHYTSIEPMREMYHNPEIPQALKDKYLVPLLISRAIPYKDLSEKVPEGIIEQFGSFVTNYTPVLALLGNSFAQMHNVLVSEYDMVDIFKNRRCGMAVVPNAGVSQNDLSAICVSNANLLKFAMDAYLGESANGHRSNISNQNRTSSDSPMGVLVDEIWVALKSGVYGTLVSQARGLGIALLAGTQDCDKPEQESPGEWGQIEGSTQQKIIMSIQKTQKNKVFVENHIHKRKIQVKETQRDNLDHSLTVNNTKIEEHFVLDVERLFNNSFEKGEFFLVAHNRFTHGRVHFIDPEKFELTSFRPITKMATLRYNDKILEKEKKRYELKYSIKQIISEASSDLITKLSSNAFLERSFKYTSTINRDICLEIEYVKTNDNVDSSIYKNTITNTFKKPFSYLKSIINESNSDYQSNSIDHESSAGDDPLSSSVSEQEDLLFDTEKEEVKDKQDDLLFEAEEEQDKDNQDDLLFEAEDEEDKEIQDDLLPEAEEEQDKDNQEDLLFEAEEVQDKGNQNELLSEAENKEYLYQSSLVNDRDQNHKSDTKSKTSLIANNEHQDITSDEESDDVTVKQDYKEIKDTSTKLREKYTFTYNPDREDIAEIKDVLDDHENIIQTSTNIKINNQLEQARGILFECGFDDSDSGISIPTMKDYEGSALDNELTLNQPDAEAIKAFLIDLQ